MSTHITSVCHTAMSCIRNIGRLRNAVDQKTCELLFNSLVTSRIDYCNTLFWQLPLSQVNRLQKIQNICARIVTRSRCRESISPILKDLHWLPVAKRIRYKILLMVYKAIMTDSSPLYLVELFAQYSPTRALRSAAENQLVVPKSQLKTFGDRAISHSAPYHWNKIPKPLRNVPRNNTTTFKRQLKTTLFSNK